MQAGDASDAGGMDASPTSHPATAPAEPLGDSQHAGSIPPQMATPAPLHVPSTDDTDHSAHVQSDILSDSHAEFDIDAQIELHLNEIQRLRASRPVPRLSPQADPRASVPQHRIASGSHVAMRTHSIHHWSPTHVANIVRAGRTIRAFPHDHHHASDVATSAAESESDAHHTHEISPESIRRRINEGAPGRTSTAETPLVEPRVSPQATSIRRRRLRGARSHVPDPFSVVISAPSPAGPHHQRSESLLSTVSSALSVHISDSDSAEHSTQSHEHDFGHREVASRLTEASLAHHYDDHTHVPASTFRFAHRPSISERLSMRSFVAPSPAHPASRSIFSPTRAGRPPMLQRASSLFVEHDDAHDNEYTHEIDSDGHDHDHHDEHGEHDDTHSDHQHHSDHHSDHDHDHAHEHDLDHDHDHDHHAGENHAHDQHGQKHGVPKHADPPPRRNSRTAPSDFLQPVMPPTDAAHHSPSRSPRSPRSRSPFDHSAEDAAVHAAATSEELAEAMAAASSTVNVLQQCATTPRPASRMLSPRSTSPFKLSPASTPGRKRSPAVSPARPLPSSQTEGTTARPPRSPMKPLMLTMQQSPPPPTAASSTSSTDGAIAPPMVAASASPPVPLRRASTLPVIPLDGDLLVSTDGTQTRKAGITTPSVLKRSMTSVRRPAAATAAGARSTSPLREPLSPTLLSPGGSGLSSSAWLERRMEKMFHDAPPTAPAEKEDVTKHDPWTDATRAVKVWLPSLLFVVIPVIILFQAVFLPMRLAFGSSRALQQVGGSFESMQAWDIPLDLVFLFGVLATDYVNLDTLTIRTSLWKRDTRGWITLVTLDVISSLPYEFITYFVSLPHLWSDPTMATPIRLTALVRLPRLLRLARLVRYLDQFEARNLVDSVVNPTGFRLCKLAVIMYLVAHWAGCGYVVLSSIEGYPEGNEWVIPTHIRSLPLGSQYLHAIYWGFASMTGNGAGVQAPQTTLEHVFALIVLLIGISTYATLIGSLSGIIQLMNSRNDSYLEKMTVVTNLMQTYRMPADVQHRVLSCLQYTFNVNTQMTTGDEDLPRARGEGWDVLQYLPSYLRSELLCRINGEIMVSVPLFRGCSDGFMRSLVPLLRPEVVIPGDYLIRTGELGREMYLVRHGQLEVIAHGVVVATLTDGSYVGEVAVMFEQKRTASVRAITFCDILVLSKDDFDSVLSQYPEVQRSMRMQATMRRNARSLQDKEFRVAEAQKGGERAAAQTTKTPKSTTNRAARMSPSAQAKTSATMTPGGSARPSATIATPSEPLSGRGSSGTPRRRPRFSVSERTDASTAIVTETRRSSVALPGATSTAPTDTANAAPPLATPSHTDASDSDRPAGLVRTQSKWKKLRLLTRGQ